MKRYISLIQFRNIETSSFNIRLHSKIDTGTLQLSLIFFIKMAELNLPSNSKISSAPPKSKRITPLSKICAKARVEQFPDDFYAEDNMLFCKFCLHSVDIFRVDTIKDYIKSKVHMKKKSSIGSSQVKQKTITTLFTSKEIRDEFILDFFKCALYLTFLLTKLIK